MQQWIRESQDLNRRFEEFGVGTLDNISDEFADVITGTKKTSDAFKSMADSIIRDLTRILVRKAIGGAIGAMFGGPAGMSIGSSIGGMMGGTIGGTGIPGIGGFYAKGGVVSGPGGPRSDSILARISAGEFIVNADAAKRNLPLLEAINGGINIGSLMPGFAAGGMVGLSALAEPETCFVGSIGGSDVCIHC